MMAVGQTFFYLAAIGFIFTTLHSCKSDRRYMQYIFLSLFLASFAFSIYYAAGDLSAGGRGFRGGDDRLWYEAGQNTLQDFKAGRSLYDLIANGVDVDWTSSMHPQQTIETGRMGYPLLLALVMGTVTDNLMMIMLLNCFLASLIPLLAYKIGVSISSAFNGKIAALLVLFSPLVFYAGANYRDIHIGLLFTLAALACIHFIKFPNAASFLQIMVFTMLLYLFRYISGLIMILGLAPLILMFTGFRYKHALSILIVVAALTAAFVGYPHLMDRAGALAAGQLQQEFLNAGEMIGDTSSSITRTVMSRFTESPTLLLALLPLPAIALQLISPPVNTTTHMWVLYWANALRFVFLLPYLLAGIYYILSERNNRPLNFLLILYLLGMLAYAPIAVFSGNRYMLSMVSLEAVFAGIGSDRPALFQRYYRAWVVLAAAYCIWYWIYNVTSGS
jgi:hypothetical protein